MGIAASRGAAVLQNHVDRQSIQPRTECTLAAKRAQALPGPHKYILCEPLGFHPACTHAQTNSVNAPDVVGVQGVERAAIVTLCTAYQMGRVAIGVGQRTFHCVSRVLLSRLLPEARMPSAQKRFENGGSSVVHSSDHPLLLYF